MKPIVAPFAWLLAVGWLALRLLAQGNPADPTLPVVTLQITAPAAGDSFPLGVEIPIRATAVDTRGGITRLEFLADGEVIGTSEIFTLVPITPGEPVQHEFVWREAPFGPHELRVRGRGSLELPTLSGPVNIQVGQIKPAAAIVLKLPADLAEFHVGDDVEIVADATDPRGLIGTVDFFANGEKIGTSTVDFCPPCLNPPCPLAPCMLPAAGTTLTHRFVWLKPAEGKYALEARSFLADGTAVLSQSVRIAVAGPSGAALTWVSPTANSSWTTPGKIPLEVTAVDPAGEIRRVEFYAGEAKLGVSEITTKEAILPGRPRTHSFVWLNPPVGEHLLRAKAVATDGLAVVSPRQPIQVTSPAPPVVTVTAVRPYALEGDRFNRGEFVLERTGDLSHDVTVFFDVAGTAQRGTDYQMVVDPCDECAKPEIEFTGHGLLMPAGRSTVTLGVLASFDGLLAVAERPTESVTVQISTPPIPEVVGAVPPYVAGNPDRAAVWVVDRRNPNAAEVVLVAPDQGAQLPAGGAAMLRAVAVDPVGSIRRVEFIANDQLIGVSEILTREMDIPGRLRVHEFLWRLTDAIQLGDYNLVAHAKDIDGGELKSWPVSVKVVSEGDILPTVTLVPRKTPAFEFGDLKSRTGSFVVARQGAEVNGAPLDVWVQVSGSAVWGVDYQWLFPGTDATGQIPAFGSFLPVQIPAGAADVTVVLEAVPDELVEGSEFVVLRLIEPPIQSLNAGLLPVPPSYRIGEPNEGWVEIFDRVLERPQVTLKVAGSEFPIGAAVSMTATAMVPGQLIGGILFLADGRPIGEVPYCCDTCRCLPPVEGAPFTATFEWKNVPAGVHKLTAQALTFANMLWESEPVTIRVGEVAKPSVVVTNPKAGATFAAAATIPVEATAVHPSLGVTGIRFFANGAEIGHALYCCEVCFCAAPVPGKPFVGSIEWKSVPPGEYTLVAKAFMLGDAILESEPVKITVKPGEPVPRLTITRPAQGETVRAGEKLQVVAVGVGRLGGITDVDLLLDGQKVAESHLDFFRPPEADEPVEHSFEVTIPDGEHQLVARDQADANVVSPPVTVFGAGGPARVTIVPGHSPAAEQGEVWHRTGSFVVARTGGDRSQPLTVFYTLGGSATLRLDYQLVEAPDDGPRQVSIPPALLVLRSVQIPAGHSSADISFTAVTDKLAEGTETVVATLVEPPFAAGGVSPLPSEYVLGEPHEATVPILDASAVLPSVVLTAPAAGSSFAASATIHVEATAVHPELGIVGLLFYANGTLIGQARYCCDLCPCAVPVPGVAFTGAIQWSGMKPGDYQLVAKALTFGDAIIASQPVTIHVGELKEPSLVIVAPTNGAAFKLGDTLHIDTVGQDPNGLVSTVEFYANGLKIGERCQLCVIDAMLQPGTPLHNQLEWKPSKAGSYLLTAVGQFGADRKVTSAPVVVRVQPDESGARLTITQPADGVTVPADQTVEVTAVGVGRFGGITDVRLLVDGQPAGESHVRFVRPPEADEEVGHTFSIRFAAGRHELVVQDLSDRAVKSPAVRVIATGDEARITWVAPEDGAAFSLGQIIPLEVSAVDPHGLFFEVEFLSGEQVIGKSIYSCLTCRPGPGATLKHQFEWNNAPAGDHVLRARSVRADGSLVSSGPLRVMVKGDSAVPWVTRDLPESYQAEVKFTVRLEAKPAASTAAYLVEDRPPHTLPTPGASGFLHPHWRVQAVSHGGAFDAATGKVKFGPFIDHEARTLTYEVVADRVVELAEFDGIGSADGVSSAIGGDRELRGSVRHPADREPADGVIAADELTGYAAAWKHEHDWPGGPNPVPMDYVTRAAALWKGGEHYFFDPEAGGPPQCWVNGVGPVLGGPDGAEERPTAGVALRTRTLRADGSVAVTIRLLAAPGTRSFAVEEQVPETGAVTDISGDGSFVGTSRTLRWGPFFTGVNPTVSYVLGGEAARLETKGTASFDGQSLPIRGGMAPAPAEASGHLVSVDTLADGSMQVSLESAELLQGAEFELQVSSDLKTWTPVGSFASDQAAGFARDTGAAGEGGRFYRAVRVR